jgi:hypothetical protein
VPVREPGGPTTFVKRFPHLAQLILTPEPGVASTPIRPQSGHRTGSSGAGPLPFSELVLSATGSSSVIRVRLRNVSEHLVPGPPGL